MAKNTVTTSRSVRVLSSQDAKIRQWRKKKLFNVSAYFQDCISILEDHPEILDSARPGEALRRAVEDAERAEELGRLMIRAIQFIDQTYEHFDRLPYDIEPIFPPDIDAMREAAAPSSEENDGES